MKEEARRGAPVAEPEPAPRWSRWAAPYMFGHEPEFIPECVLAVDKDDVEDGVGDLEVAAWASAVPPPTRTPESVKATRACRSRRMFSPPSRCGRRLQSTPA